MIISAGVVLKERKVLFSHKKRPLVLPKGHVEAEESFDRLLFEKFLKKGEARIRRLGWKYFQFHAQGEIRSKRVLWFLMEQIGGRPRPLRSEGFVEVAYMPEDQLENLNMHSSELSIVRKALRQEA